MLAEDMLDNLDGMYVDDLRDYAERLKRRYKETPAGTDDNLTREMLISYSLTKVEAMEKRASGDIPEALRLEGRCDVTYHQLPSYARW